MRIPHKLAHNLALITFLLTLPFLVADANAQVPCATPPALPEGKITTWKQGATVNVMIDPTFTDPQIRAIKDQFDKWKNAGGANVTFNFVEPSQAGGGATTGGPPIVSVMRQIPDKKGATAQGETEGFSFNGSRGDTFIDINPGVTDPTAFIHVMSHEIGHTFGLDECPTCPAGSSAMTEPPSGSLNAAGGHDGPTPCDSNKVKEQGQYPTPTPTPTPEPDPCASQVQGSGLVISNALCSGDGGDLAESGSAECNDGIDNDQDGMVDCDDPSCPRCPSGCSSYQQDLCFAIGAMGCWQGMCYTPILIDVNGDGYKMTNAANGVNFKVLPNFRLTRLSWTAENSDDAWLVLDRNGNNTIDSGEEQFGNATPQPSSTEKNGFKALAQYDSVFYGGNEDGVIDGRDAVFAQLQLWCDRNHNGISEPDELSDLPSAGLFGIDLNYKEWKKVDEFGNPFRYRAKLLDGSGHSLGKWAFDVFLKTY